MCWCELLLNQMWAIERLRLQQRNREHRVFPVLLLSALMAGAFLLPALSPEDGIPVVQAGSCSAALHCDEFSTDVFLLLLLSTLPVLLFSPACLQPQCSRFLNMSSSFLLLFSMLLLNFCVFFWYGLGVSVCVFGCVFMCMFSYYYATVLTIPSAYDQTTTEYVNWKISWTAVKTENLVTIHFQVGCKKCYQVIKCYRNISFYTVFPLIFCIFSFNPAQTPPIQTCVYKWPI